MLGIRTTGATRRRVLTTFMAMALGAGSLLVQSTPAAGVTCTVNGIVNPSTSDVQDLLDGTAANITFSGYCFLDGLDIDRDVNLIGTSGATIDADGTPDTIFDIYDNAQVTMTGLTLIEAGNSAISIDPGVLRVSRSTFRDNIDPDGCDEGGAIWVGNGSDLFVTTSTFTGNQACEGGAIYGAYPDQIDISSSTFTTNSSWEIGGAIFVDGCFYDASSCLTISKSNFTGNVSGDIGGAVGLLGTAANVSMSNFTRNVAFNGGGAIVSIGWYLYYGFGGGLGAGSFGSGDMVIPAEDGYYGSPDLGGTLAISGSNFTSNSVQGASGGPFGGGGGAIATYLIDELRVSSSKFVGNAATLAGGAIAAFVTDFETTGSTYSRNSVIDADDEAGGGAVALWNSGAPWPSSAKITASTFSSNSAISFGGAIWTDYPFVEMARSKFSANVSVYGNGGAIAAEAYEFSDTSSVFEANKAPSDEYGDGGAIYLRFGEVGFHGTVIRNNVAVSDGGGVFANGAEVIFDGAKITGNRAQGSGGGVAVLPIDDDAALALVGGTVVSQNSAFFDGGGVFMLDFFDGPDVYASISGATLTGNKAVHSGGAIFFVSCCGLGDASFSITDAVIDRNTAGDNGGGIFIDSDEAADLTISDIDGPVSVSYNKVTQPDGDGGGIWVDLDWFDIVTDEWAGGTAPATVKILYNKARGEGAGIYASNLDGSSYLGDGTWVRYNADGGIWDYDCEIYWDDAVVLNNAVYQYWCD